MKLRVLFPVVGVVALLLFSGCGVGAPAQPLASAKMKSLFEESFQIQDDFDALIETVVDADSAREAEPKLSQLYSQLVAKLEELEQFNKKAYISGAITDIDLRSMESVVVEKRNASIERNRKVQERIESEPEIMAVLKPLFDRIRSGPIK